MLNKILIIIVAVISFLLLSSCQKSQILDDVIFDNTLLNYIDFNVGKKEINVTYKATLNEPFIDHVMSKSPTTRVISWLENNINKFGNENKLVINIQKASIAKTSFDREVQVAGINKKQNEYLYELNFKVLFILYNDSDQILATVQAEAFHSTTSSEFISLNERDRILDKLTLDSLQSLSDKSFELIKGHMSEYVL